MGLIELLIALTALMLALPGAIWVILCLKDRWSKGEVESSLAGQNHLGMEAPNTHEEAVNVGGGSLLRSVFTQTKEYARSRQMLIRQGYIEW